MQAYEEAERMEKMKDRIESLLLSTEREGMENLLTWIDRKSVV